MASRHMARKVHWTVAAAAIIGLISAGGLAARPAVAGDLKQIDASVKLIPADPAFYNSILRTREQIELIGKSRAWKKVTEMPMYQMGMMVYQMAATNPDGPIAQIKKAMEDPEDRKVFDLLGDMVSNEIFFYGDESFVGFLELMQELNAANSFGAPLMQLTGQAEDVDRNQLKGMVILATLTENLDLIKVPNLVVGFKLSDTKLANEQLERLYKELTEEWEGNEQMQGRLKKAKVSGHKFLVLTLDGKMIPWDELPLVLFKGMEAEEGDMDKLVAHLKKLKLVICLGVRDDYLLLSIGSSAKCLRRLGKGKLLIDQPEMKPLAKFTDKRLTSIGFLSKAANARISGQAEDIDGIVELVNELLPMAELDAKQEEQVRKDVADLAEDVKGLVPEPGAVMSFSFMTDEGIESYKHDWGENLELDGSKPLGLLKHVGGNPILAVVARGKQSPEQYDLLAKWIKVGYGYIEKYALPEMPEKEREKFQQFMDLANPLLKRLDKANREMLIPALADGQTGLVVDTKLKSKQIHESMDPTDELLPIIEPAIVLGVSDAELLRKACGEYRAVVQGLVDAVRKVTPDAIPEEFKIPKPEVTESDVGTIYAYPLPEDWGVDEQIVPNAGLSEKVAVLSISREHTRRLLQSAPLAAGGALANPARPLAMAVVFDWAGLVEAATPWVDLIVEELVNPDGGNEEQVGVTKGQIKPILEVLKVIRTITAEGYFEDGAVVTHTLVEIRDVK